MTKDVLVSEATVTKYAYKEVRVGDGAMMRTVWDSSDQRDKEVVAFKGAPNECQLLSIPGDAKSVDHLALQINVVGTDSNGSDIHEYSLAADNAAYDAMRMEEIRAERDKLLTECDFSQLEDAPYDTATKASWATYRQELRDLPASIVDVDSFSWPVKPS